MIKIAAIDASQDWIHIERKITESCLKNRLEYTFYGYIDIDKFLSGYKKEYFDIVLVDMDMKKSDYLEITRKIKMSYIDAVVVYVTNRVEYGIEDFEANPFRYIPKKILKEKLPLAYEFIITELKNKDKFTFIYQNSSQKTSIPEDDIYYLSKDKKCVILVYKLGQDKIYTTLENMYVQLKSNFFVYIGKNYVVNLKHIMGLEKQQIIMRNGFHIKVRHTQLNSIKTRIMQYWRNE